MTTTLKKICVMILVIALLVCQLSTAAYAMEYESENDAVIEKLLKNYSIKEKDSIKKTVEKDFKLLSDLGLLNDTTILEIFESQENNQSTLSYVIDFGDVINTVEIITNTSESYNIKFIEGNKVGVMRKTHDDRIYLNDKEMTIETIDKENKSLTTGVIVPCATETWFQTRCPYGSVSDYTHKLTTLSYNATEIRFNTYLRELPFAMFKAGLVAKLAGKLGLSQAKSFAASYILDFLTDINPTSKAVSYSIQVYTHKNYTSGFIGPIITRVWKYSYKYYATPNLTGQYTEDYEFKCQM